MKKMSLVMAILLVSCSLSACGNHSSSNHKSSKQTSTKVVKRHKNKKATKTSTSSSSTVSSANSSQSQQAIVNNNQQRSASNGQLPPANDLHDFVNRYGESPAAYLSQHYGMSPEQAVQSVPDNMKTSGEIQDTNMLQKGQDPFK